MPDCLISFAGDSVRFGYHSSHNLHQIPTKYYGNYSDQEGIQIQAVGFWGELPHYKILLNTYCGSKFRNATRSTILPDPS